MAPELVGSLDDAFGETPKPAAASFCVAVGATVDVGLEVGLSFEYCAVVALREDRLGRIGSCACE